MAKLTVKELESLTIVDVGKRLTDEHSLFGVAKSKGKVLLFCFVGDTGSMAKLHDYTCGTWPS
ncbi:MAG: hypothetical protein IPJ48_05220 [Propionivibrio sp.]|uniref:Uncharacterized protein n=1 Tax=Candidatus Propionivibrio dominans TaxID=2954373 RepID=A0A9D7F5M5_9RHOO|nr:hypothetical protein [Candidatus Propionivibrio dominans]